MNMILRAVSPLALAAASLLVVPAHAAAAPKAKAKVAAKAINTIIPLPLKPIVAAGQRVCAATAANGLGSTMLRAATGPKPVAADYVLVNYIGYLASTGAVFDQGMEAGFPVGRVIPGFAQGLQLLSKGGVVRLCIPAALGYGARASGPIPANSDLVFQVELVDFKTAAEVEVLRKAQAEAEAKAAEAAKAEAAKAAEAVKEPAKEAAKEPVTPPKPAAPKP